VGAGETREGKSADGVAPSFKGPEVRGRLPRRAEVGAGGGCQDRARCGGLGEELTGGPEQSTAERGRARARQRRLRLRRGAAQQERREEGETKRAKGKKTGQRAKCEGGKRE
jgi:hypothetical protein